MTLPNFSWTDKNSIRWYVLLPTGHEGPYSLQQLIDKSLGNQSPIWAEGLDSPVTFERAKDLFHRPPEAHIEEEVAPQLPLLPADDDVPPIPLGMHEAVAVTEDPGKPRLLRYLGGQILVLAILGLGIQQWVKSQEVFELRRPPGMSLPVYQKIIADFQFQGWNKDLFLKEYVPEDLSRLWFASASFYACEVTGAFRSVEGKLLSRKESRVAFRSTSELRGHLLEFSKFEFIEGARIIPGLYEVDLDAKNCQWDGWTAKLANFFSPPESDYKSRMKVILYPRGAIEFNAILEKFIRKKLEAEVAQENQEQLFWEDLQQKFQTLLAITLQIEQSLAEFLEKEPKAFSRNLKPFVEGYTKKFGHFLTNFVVANEEYFKELDKLGLKHIGTKRQYESKVKLTAKSIGLESMKIIENLQRLKNPDKKALRARGESSKKVFGQLKELINKRIVDVTDERSAQN